MPSVLRRRKKSAPREDRPAPSETRSRRRPRPGVEVPPQFKLSNARTPPAITPHEPPRREPKRRDGDVVLVTGFDPFNGEGLNPSWEICERLPAEIAGARVETCRVPCEFGKSIKVVADAIERHRPSLVICLGQAGGRVQMSVERVAINVVDARIADNAGAQPIDRPIEPKGPPAYFATVPIKAMAQAMRAAGVPAQVSNTAGTYVCNHLMYGVLHHLATRGHAARAGFIHVPFAEEQVLDKPAAASMSLATMVKGVEAAIAAARARTADIVAAEGQLD